MMAFARAARDPVSRFVFRINRSRIFRKIENTASVSSMPPILASCDFQASFPKPQQSKGLSWMACEYRTIIPRVNLCRLPHRLNG
jgi:hypothetical protein